VEVDVINRQLVHYDTAGQRVILNPGQLVNTGGDYYDVAGGGGGGSPGYYGSFYDTTNQIAAAINTGYPITLDTTVENNGVSIVSGSRITVAAGGVYNIQFSAQFVNTDTSIHEVTMWLRLNGTDIAYSSGAVSVPNSHGGIHGQIIAAWNYVMTLSAGDYLQFYWQTPNTNVYIEKVIDGAAPISPSMIVTVTQVASTVAGPTGPAGTSLLYGATAPVVATGSDGDFYINTTTNYLYGPKASGAWPAGTPLTAGTGPAGGDLTGTYPNPTLAPISTAATKGTAAKSATVTIDDKGRVTSISDQNIAIAQSQVTNLTTDLAAKAALAGATFTGSVNIGPTSASQLFLTGTGNLRMGIGFSAGSFSNANAVLEIKPHASTRFTFLDNVVGALHNPVFVLADLDATGKGMALYADTTASAFIYDNTGGFNITSDTKANIQGGTFGSGTLRFAVEATTGLAHAYYGLQADANSTVTLAQSARTSLTVSNSSTNAAAEAGTVATSSAGTVFYGTGSSASSKVAGGMIYTADAIPLTLWTNGLRRVTVTGADGNVGIGVASGTAYLHIKAGTATGGTAPLKINSGTNMSTPESGAVEYDGTDWYLTDSTPTRRTVDYLPTVTSSATPVTVPAKGGFVRVVGAAGAKTVNLPALTSVKTGTRVIVKDSSGTAAGGTITITPNGTDTIDGAATATITTNYGVVRLFATGSAGRWEIW
jgi:hypothetical protein